jgi:hypothetical protein
MQELRQEVHAKESEDSARSMNIRSLAFDMAKAVEIFIDKAKRFFYDVMLLGYRCPKCNGSLKMAAEGRCKCLSCGNELDVTVTFQRCSACGGIPMLKVRHYECRDCHSDIRSKFLFDGMVFDAEYFRHKVAESRQRRKEQRERVRQMLEECRSADLPLGMADLDSVPGLLDALNALTAGVDEGFIIESRDRFDLRRYESHIQAHIQDFPLSLGEIPPLSENPKKDLIWRFIAVIFLAHAGTIDIWQEGQAIMVMKHETYRKGQGISGELEEADGIEGSVGRIEAW